MPSLRRLPASSQPEGRVQISRAPAESELVDEVQFPCASLQAICLPQLKAWDTELVFQFSPSFNGSK